MKDKAKQLGLSNADSGKLLSVDHTGAKGVKGSIATSQTVDKLTTNTADSVGQTMVDDGASAGNVDDNNDFAEFFVDTETAQREDILNYINYKKLAVDHQRDLTRTAKARQNTKKGGFLRLFADAARSIESVFSPSAEMYRNQKEMLENEMTSLRESLEHDLAEIGDGYEVVYDYIARKKDETCKVVTYRDSAASETEQATNMVVDMSDAKNSHEIIDRMIYQMIHDRNHPAFGEIRGEIERRVNARVKRYNQELAGFRNKVDASQFSKMAALAVSTNTAVVNDDTLTDSGKFMRMDSGARGIRENMEDLAKSSLYVRLKEKLFGSKPADKAPINSSGAAPFTVIEGLHVLYTNVTQEAQIKFGLLTGTEEATATSVAKLNKRRKALYAKRGLQAVMAAAVIGLAGGGMYGTFRTNQKLSTDTMASNSDKSAEGQKPVAPVVAKVIPSAASTAQPSVVPSAVASVPASSGPKSALAENKKPVAKSPSFGYQSSQPKAKVSTVTKPELTEKQPEVKKKEAKVAVSTGVKQPETKKPEIKQPEQKKTVEFDLERKGAELIKVSKRIQAIQARFTAFERPVRVPVHNQKGGFNYVAADASEIPGMLDNVMTRIKTWNTQADADAVSAELNKIEAKMRALETDRALQTVPVYIASAEMDSRLALDALNKTFDKLGGKSHKFTIHRVVGAQKDGKDTTAIFENTEVDLDAAKAALERIIDRAKKSSPSTTEEEAFADSVMAQKWLTHIKSISKWIDFAGNKPESMTASYITYHN